MMFRAILDIVQGVNPFPNSVYPQDGDESAVHQGNDENVSLLLREGFLARTSRAALGFQFFSPSISKFVKSIGQGRKELLSIVNRKKDKRIPEIALFGGKTRLKQSVLHVKFHLRDLEGKGLMKRIQTTVGTFWHVL